MVAVEGCLETDLDGHRTRTRIWFPTWSFDNGTTKDEALQGAVIEVYGRGKDRPSRWSAADGATNPAMAWLDRAYGASRPGGERCVARGCRVAVAVDDAWGADLAAV